MTKRDFFKPYLCQVVFLCFAFTLFLVQNHLVLIFSFQQSPRKTLRLYLRIREYIKTIDLQQVRGNVDWGGWGKFSKCQCGLNKITAYTERGFVKRILLS